MTYHATQWYLDESGHWLRYVARRIGDGRYSTKRDTRNEGCPMSFSDAEFGFGIPTVDTALSAITLFNLMRDGFPDEKTRAFVDENASRCCGFNIDNAAAFVNTEPRRGKDRTFADGTGAAFLRCLLQYPRFVLPSGGVEVGGIDYLNLWRDKTPLPKRSYSTPEEYLADESRRRGGFDETVAAFLETVAWIGTSTHTNGAAQKAQNKINALVNAFTTTADLTVVDKLAYEAEYALQDFCCALAERKDDVLENEDIEVVKNGVEFLVAREQEKIRKRKERGRENQVNGNTDKRDRAARDMETALQRVHDRVSHGVKNLAQICRGVCNHFARLDNHKNAAGEYDHFAPLTSASDNPIQPDTLARYYRKKYGTAKKRKENAPKNKARTQAARKAKKRTK